MKDFVKQTLFLAICIDILLIVGTVHQAGAYEVTLSFYNQGFNIEAFYNNGDFDIEAGIVEADPTSLLVILGDPANVEEVLKIPEIPDPFELAELGSDFHFEVFQPFRFQDRFDGLFSTTVDDPVLFVPDNGTVTSFRDDGLLADDRINLTAYATELPEVYYEMDWGDTLTMTTNDGTNLYITGIWRNSDYTVSFYISNVPEPGAIVLVGIGLIGIIGFVRRKSMRKKCVPIVRSFIVIGLLFACYAAFSSTVMADEIEDKIMQKWQQMRDNGLDIGEATREVVPAWGSPYGTEGSVRFFENGDIYYHSNGPRAGQVFEVHGRIYGTYNDEKGSSSFLGFPISDEKPNGPFGHAVSYFEGGCITSDDGINYDIVIKGCKEGQPPLPPELVSVEGPGCAKAEYLGSGKFGHELSRNEFYNWNFEPYKPTGFDITFAPPITEMPWYDITMTKDVEFKISAKDSNSGADYGSISHAITLVNEDASVGFDTDGISQIAKLRQAVDSVFHYMERFGKAWDVFNFVANATGGGCEKDSDIPGLIKDIKAFGYNKTIGYEYSKICCPYSDPSVVGKHTLYGGFSVEIGSIACDSPSVPIGGGINVGLTIEGGLGASVNLNAETTCTWRKICIAPSLDLDASVGVYLSFIHRKVLRASLTGGANGSLEYSDFCYDFTWEKLDLGKGKLCIAPKIYGKVTVFSFVTKGVDISLGGKRCMDL